MSGEPRQGDHWQQLCEMAERNRELEAALARVRAALINLVAAEDRYVRESGMTLTDPISAAVDDARAALEGR